MKRYSVLFFLILSLLLCAACGAPEATPTPAQPSDTPKPHFESGVIEDSVYSNTYLKLSFTLPEDWSFLDQDEFLQRFDDNFNQVASELEVGSLPENSTYYEFYAQGQSGESIVMTVENLAAHDGGKLLTVKDFVATLSEQFAQLTSVNYTIGESYTQHLAGRDMIILPLEVSDVELMQHCCVFRSGDYMVTLTFSAQDAQELASLESCLAEI
ncbi:MAG: hypothetical protein ACOX81_05110 [Candidatus Heteroscillospira sp.]|jgi:hypothetical protein